MASRLKDAEDASATPAVTKSGRVSYYIGVNHPAIVREIPHFDVFPAFPNFSENVPHFWLYFEKQIFLIIVIILGARKKLCA